MDFNLYGMNFNSMTSAALTNYGVELKKRIEALNNKKSNKTITRDEKRELEANSKILIAVSNQNKRLINLDAKLKKNGINLGSIRNYSINTLTRDGIKNINTEIEKEGNSGSKRQKDLINLRKLLGAESGRNMSKGTFAFNVVNDGMKVAATGFGASAAGMVVANAAHAIGNIQVQAAGTAFVDASGNIVEGATQIGDKIGGVEVTGTTDISAQTLSEAMKQYAPWVGTVIGLAATAGVAFFIVKKMKNYQMAQAMGMNGAQAHQLDAEDKSTKESKNTTIKTEADRAEADPSYLETLKTTLAGADMNAIIAEGPAGKYTAAQYNAARILSEVHERATSTDGYQLAQSKGEIADAKSEVKRLEAESSTLATEIANLDREINQLQFSTIEDPGSSPNAEAKFKFINEVAGKLTKAGIKSLNANKFFEINEVDVPDDISKPDGPKHKEKQQVTKNEADLNKKYFAAKQALQTARDKNKDRIKDLKDQKNAAESKKSKADKDKKIAEKTLKGLLEKEGAEMGLS